MRRLLIILIALCVAGTGYADDFMYFKKKAAAGGGGSCDGTQNFVGSPGATEAFDATGGGFCTGQFSETDAGGAISISDTAEHDGTYGMLFTNASTEHTVYIKADLGAVEASYSLSWWMYVGATASIYNNYPIVRGRSDDLPNGTGTADSLYVVFNNNDSDWGLIIYASQGATTTFTASGGTNGYGAWYKITLDRTNNSAGGLTVKIYNAAESLLNTITCDTTDDLTQYIYWFDQPSGNNFFVDTIIYNATDP